MNIQILPPEIASTQIFSGMGPAPLLSAAAGWNSLASELGSAAKSFESVTTELVAGPWQGSAASAMTASATPYLAWLSAASAQADNAAALARTAASAFEAAQAAMVHPVAIAANRNQLVSLVMSNLFGFNAPAIAAAEAEYELMWAQDIAAMLGYHGEASAIASALAPFAQPLTNLAGLPAQAAGALAAAVNPAPVGPLPALAVGLPEITIPPINVPRFLLPTLNILNLTVGNFSLPQITIPQISTGNFTVPPLSISATASSLTIPSFTFPAFSIPGVTLGGFSTPQLATAPLVLPSLRIPATGFWIPFGGSNIPGNPGQLTSHNPSLNYASIVLSGVPNILVNSGILGITIDLGIPSTIYMNWAVQVLGPTATPGIYVGDFNLATGQFTSGTGFVLPPIKVSGFTIPDISIPAWQTPDITLTSPGLTLNTGSIDVTGLSVGPVTIPPIGISDFQVPNIGVGRIDVGAFTTPGPITGTGSLDIGLLNLIPRIHIDWTNPFEGLIHPGPAGPYFGPLETPQITVSIDTPQITIPPVAIPPFNLNALSVPPISVSPFGLGQISVPGIQINGVNVGAISVPNVTVTPQLPNISVGPFSTPTIKTGAFALPTISVPTITTPAISIYNPANPVNTFGLDLNTWAYVDLTGSRISIVPNPFNTRVHFGIPATQIPPLTLVNGANPLNPFSFVFNGNLGALSLPPISVDAFNLALNGPAVQLTDILVNPINLGPITLPTLNVPPITVGGLAGFNLPQLDIGGIQVGGFSTPDPVVIPPITLTQTILPSFTLVPAIPL
ncbi:PPE family protein [Mycobacterium sp. ML4]